MGSMKAFLKNINLSKHEDLLNGQGYENQQDIFTLNENDLNALSMDKTDIATILKAG